MIRIAEFPVRHSKPEIESDSIFILHYNYKNNNTHIIVKRYIPPNYVSAA